MPLVRGPRAKHKADALEMDLEFISEKLKNFEKESRLGYEGNWHTHPGFPSVCIPSRTDKRLMRDVVDSGNYDVEMAVCMITPSEPANLSDFNCFLFRKDSHGHIAVTTRIFGL
jgi:hypothetical protein